VIAGDPAFGTPLGPGATITLTVSTRLGAHQVMSDDFLARNGVHIEPLGTVSAADRARIDRTRSTIESALAAHPIPWDTQLVLRRITTDHPVGTASRSSSIASPGWSSPRALVASLGRPCCGHVSPPAGLGRDISVYDAVTGDFEWAESF
jgi:hypothetical protein